MDGVKLFAATLVATLAVVAISVASASAAAPELGATSLPTEFASAGSGNSELKSSVGTLACTAHSSVGTFTTQKAGTITMLFTGCSSEGISCKSLAETSGTIAVPGAGIELVVLAGPHLGAHITLASTLKVRCGVLTIEIEGAVLGDFTTVTVTGEKVKQGESRNLVLKAAAGAQEWEAAETPALTGIKLEANFGIGFRPAVQISTDAFRFGAEVAPTF
jgi:hypothetical protein